MMTNGNVDESLKKRPSLFIFMCNINFMQAFFILYYCSLLFCPISNKLVSLLLLKGK